MSRIVGRDCHKWIKEHDDKLVREVLKYWNSYLLREVACNSQVYSDSLVFLALRMIHRHPLSLTVVGEGGYTPLQVARLSYINGCREIRKEHASVHVIPTPWRWKQIPSVGIS